MTGGFRRVDRCVRIKRAQNLSLACSNLTLRECNLFTTKCRFSSVAANARNAAERNDVGIRPLQRLSNSSVKDHTARKDNNEADTYPSYLSFRHILPLQEDQPGAAFFDGLEKQMEGERFNMDRFMQTTKSFQEELYKEAQGFAYNTQSNSSSSTNDPTENIGDLHRSRNDMERNGDYLYWNDTHPQTLRPIFRRQKLGAHTDETILDLNSFRSPFVDVPVMKLDQKHEILAYVVDQVGDESYELRFRRLGAKARLGKPDPLDSLVVPGVRNVEFINTTMNSVGINESECEDASRNIVNRNANGNDKVFLYTTMVPLTKRSNQVWLQRVGEQGCTKPELVLSAEGEEEYVDVSKSKDGCMVFISRVSKGFTEVYLYTSSKLGGSTLDGTTSGGSISGHNSSAGGTLDCIKPRQRNAEYYCEHHDGKLIVVSNHTDGANSESCKPILTAETSEPSPDRLKVRKEECRVSYEHHGHEKREFEKDREMSKPDPKFAVYQWREGVLEKLLDTGEMKIQEIDMFENGLVLYGHRVTRPEIAFVRFKNSIVPPENGNATPTSAHTSDYTIHDQNTIDSIDILQFSEPGCVIPAVNASAGEGEFKFTVATPISKINFTWELVATISGKNSSKNESIRVFHDHKLAPFLRSKTEAEFSNSYSVTATAIASRDGLIDIPLTIVSPKSLVGTALTVANKGGNSTDDFLENARNFLSSSLVEKVRTYKKQKPSVHHLAGMLDKIHRRGTVSPLQIYRDMVTPEGSSQLIEKDVDLAGPNVGRTPCVVRFYGAYGMNMDLDFRYENLLLLKRGFSIVYVHPRGGGEVGWQSGRGLNKGNTATDVLDVVQYLRGEQRKHLAKGVLAISSEQASSESPSQENLPKLVLQTSSAGAMACGGSVLAEFDAAVMDGPFLDPVGVMSNPSLPLVKHEESEWGRIIVEEKDEKVDEEPENANTVNPSSFDKTIRMALRNLRSISPLSSPITKEYFPPLYLSVAQADARVPSWVSMRYVKSMRERLGIEMASLQGERLGMRGMRKRGKRGSDADNATTPLCVNVRGGSHTHSDTDGFAEEIQKVAFIFKALKLS